MSNIYTKEQQQGFFIVSAVFILIVGLTNFFIPDRTSNGERGIKPWTASKYLLGLVAFYVVGGIIVTSMGPMSYSFEILMMVLSAVGVLGVIIYILLLKNSVRDSPEKYSVVVEKDETGERKPSIKENETETEKPFIKKSFYTFPLGMLLLVNVVTLVFAMMSEGFSSVKQEQEERQVVEEKDVEPDVPNGGLDNILYSYNQDLGLAGQKIVEEDIRELDPDYEFTPPPISNFENSNEEFIADKAYGYDELYNYTNLKYQRETIGT